MRIDFVTLFPEAALCAVRHSMLKRAEEAGLVAFGSSNPRDFATDAHRTVDDEPYGGGPGMVMKPDVVAAAIEAVLTPPPDPLPIFPSSKHGGVSLASTHGGVEAAIVFTDPAGERFTQQTATELAGRGQIVFVCGHYEGIDERVVEKYATHRLSIGDYVLTGGELAAGVMADAVVRLLPGVLGDPASLEEDAFADGLLTYPQYTRPAEWEGRAAPEVLLSGDHGEIAKWRRRIRLKTTRERRPELFARAPLSKDDLKLLQ